MSIFSRKLKILRQIIYDKGVHADLEKIRTIQD